MSRGINYNYRLEGYPSPNADVTSAKAVKFFDNEKLVGNVSISLRCENLNLEFRGLGNSTEYQSAAPLAYLNSTKKRDDEMEKYPPNVKWEKTYVDKKSTFGFNTYMITNDEGTVAMTKRYHADIIQASPEMLETLKGLRSWMLDLIKFSTDGSVSDNVKVGLTHHVVKIEKAILKAQPTFFTGHKIVKQNNV